MGRALRVAALWLALAAAPAAAAEVTVADHVGTYTGSAIDWRSRIVLAPGAGAGAVVDLAVPLPAASGLRATDAAPIVVGDQVLGLRLEAPRAELVLTARQPLPGGEGEALAPPLVVGDAVQRVRVTGLDYEPAAALGLEQHLRHTLAPVVGPRQRRQVDRLLASGGRARGPRLYVVVDERLVAAGGLVGEVRPQGALPSGVVGGVGAAFVLALGAGAVGHRLLEAQARRERIEAWARDERVQAELRAAATAASEGERGPAARPGR